VVATLVGLSVDYYTQIERGKVGGVSNSVLDAVAPALELDEAERSHLFDLHRARHHRPAPGAFPPHHNHPPLLVVR
jgi:transcriptional regulator with XRE-family HTH domain